ncbi:50S ribosomal protein L11 methyltransferase [Arsenicitalea aurantiaca]|uniref:Ribosomal protein L11 methyltransferase n=1 Tax=Arsenicitalea aurantiaca TaxID=1783274 RepID=A0A433XM54_9HYPH|nr:50S ribosomal protein L11 methyltransferase [Arsenicitalea aurantiaca]RUT35133.1 50S ribosomal protein L11 methyltransferase [Arsenicitalea aurantiaca]
MALSQLSLALTKDQAYALVDAVMERDDLAVTASAHEDAETGEWIFEATCLERPELDSFSELARLTLGGDVEFRIEEIDPSVNWVAKSLEGLHPVRAGGFYVYGSHETAPVPGGLTGIRIDAAQAFGTGHHETTTGCLEAIDRALKRRRFTNVIDIGTGTGVLAIAVAKRLKRRVLATDIDPVAVSTTLGNARDNGVERQIVAIEAEGLDHHLIASGAPYDLVIANILAGPLAALAPGMARITQRGATIILSGILNQQAPRVTSAYVGQSMILRSKITRGNWSTLVLEKR